MALCAEVGIWGKRMAGGEAAQEAQDSHTDFLELGGLPAIYPNLLSSDPTKLENMVRLSMC